MSQELKTNTICLKFLNILFRLLLLYFPYSFFINVLDLKYYGKNIEK